MLIKPAVRDYLDRLPTMPNKTEFPTFVDKLDSKLWFSRKNLNIIASRTSNNKSTFILNSLAVPTAESNKKVILYTLEDPKDRYLRRYLACKSSITNSRIKQRIITETEYEQLNMWQRAMNNIPLDIIEEKGYEIEEIEKDLEVRHPDMVIIDYLNKIKTINNSRIETINNYLRQFSLLSKKHDFCGVVCCQINREAMGEGNRKEILPPQLHHIKESGDIEQICDVAIILHWAYKYDILADKNIMNVIIAKNKDGDCGGFDVRIEPEFNRITNLIGG